MTAAVISVLLTFILVTVVGGIFVHSLQHRNWIRQQHISNHEKLVSELKSIFVDLDSLLSKRLFRTRRVLYALRHGNADRIKESVDNYDNVICEWNEKRNSFQIRLVRVISVELATDNFEHDLSRRFVRIGGQLERLARAALSGSLPSNFRDTLTDLELELDFLSRSVYEFSREIYKKLQQEQNQLFYIDRFNKIPETSEEFDQISTWFLFKSLFIPAPVPTKES